MGYDNSEIIHKKFDGIEVLQFKALLEYSNDIQHCFTLRHGGYSQKDFSSLNLGVNTNDDIQVVKENYKLLCEKVGFEYSNLFRGIQIHSDKVVFVDKSNCGVLVNNTEIECDGSITNIKNIPLVTNCADCMTILIYDNNTKYIASIHAGWQGVLNRIVVKCIHTLVKHYDVTADNLIVCVSPHICTQCFEVMSDVKEKFENVFSYNNMIYTKDSTHYLIDLQSILKEDLLNAGVRKINIHFAGICNKCNMKDFYSFRNNSNTGRMACCIMLK